MSRDAVDYAFVNPDLNSEARELCQDIPMRAEPGALDEYIRCWSEDDVIDGRPCRALVDVDYVSVPSDQPAKCQSDD